MSGDISPLSPASATPLVREKRHYPGEQKEKNLKKQAQDVQTSDDEQAKNESDDDEQAKNESDDDEQENTVNRDEKNVKIGHIDEYV
jgi:hypothetical protein